MFNLSLGFAAWLRQECLMFNVNLLPHVAEFLSARGKYFCLV